MYDHTTCMFIYVYIHVFVYITARDKTRLDESRPVKRGKLLLQLEPAAAGGPTSWPGTGPRKLAGSASLFMNKVLAYSEQPLQY